MQSGYVDSKCFDHWPFSFLWFLACILQGDVVLLIACLTVYPETVCRQVSHSSAW